MEGSLFDIQALNGCGGGGVEARGFRWDGGWINRCR